MKTVFDLDSIYLKDLPNVIKLMDDLVKEYINKLDYKATYRYLSTEEIYELDIDKEKIEPITYIKNMTLFKYKDLLIIMVKDTLFAVKCIKEET